MELDEAITARRSVREFVATAVPPEHIEEIVQAGLLAPTASNRQHWRIIAITEPETIKKLHVEVGAQDIVFNPPVVLTVLYNPLFNDRRSAHVQSSAAAVENILLKATSMGYGTTWVAGMGDDEKLRSLLGIPAAWEPMCYVLLGKIAKSFPPPPPKYSVEEVLFFEKFVEEEIDLPNSIKPRNCTLEQIGNHQNYLSRSSYLGKDYDYQHGLEISEIYERINGIAGEVSKSIVSFYAYDGTVYRHLNGLMSNHNFTDVELSLGAKEFVEYKSPLSEFTVTQEQTNLQSGSIDLCICLFSLEKLPDYTIVLREARRILKSDGKLLVFFKNKRSFYGLVYFLVEKILGVRSISAVFPLSPGPYEPILSSKLVKDVRKYGFSVTRKEGLFFLPAEVLIFSEKVDGYLKRHGKYLNMFRFLIRPAIKSAVVGFYASRNIRSFKLGSSCFVLAGLEEREL